MRTSYSPINNVPFRGGAITVREKPLVPFGGYSAKQNIRDNHPGFKKRKGCRALHTTADSTNKVLTLYQFRKNKFDEIYTFAQMGDGDVLQATADPPTVTTGVFGAEVHDGTASGMKPAAWATIRDMLVYSNSVDQHQIFTGTELYVLKFVKYDGSAAPPNVPELGFDYTTEVTNGSASTCAVLDSLNTYANNECVFICTPVPANRLTWTISKPNGTSSTATLYYRKNDLTWADTSMTDGTAASGATLATTDGAMTWTPPSDEQPCFMFGVCGFWYQLRVGTQLDSEVEITEVTYGSQFQDIINVWDGAVVPAVEVYVEGTTQYETYGSGAVDLDTLTAGKKIYIVASTRIEGVYWDVGEFPNATGTALTSLKYWDGDSWVSVGTVSDGTSGISNSGWMTFPRKAAQPLQFQSSQYYAYVYEVIFDSNLAADMLVAIDVMPYYDVSDFGLKGVACCTWKDRVCYSFERYPEYIYVSSNSGPLQLNGSDYGILEAGDGRSHKVLAMARFHNEMIAWQEEKGVEGGCTTLFEGYSPTTFGKLVLSSKIGIMNAKSFAVVDGVMTATASEEKIKTLVFWLSRYGICVTDGRTVSIISDDVGNYFDQTSSDCIRLGYEDQMWLTHDSAYNVLRVGLVTGGSATVPNTFLVFDLTDKTWGTDSLGQALACAAEVEAGSGQAPIVQVGGGTADGLIYQLNYGTNDVSTAITSYLQLEFTGAGEYLSLREIVLRCKTQSAGNISMTVYGNDIAKISDKSLSMVAEVTSQLIRRHRIPMSVTDQHISIKFQHATASQSMELYDIGVSIARWIGR